MTRSPHRSIAVALLVVVGSALLSPIGAGATEARAGDAPIRLLAATFHPQRGEAPVVPSDLRADPVPPGTAGYYIVQFAGPILSDWRHRLEATGAQALGYIPDFAFKTRMTPEQAAVVATLPEVAWVGPFHPAYRIAPGALESGPGLFRIRIEAGANGSAAAVSVLKSGAVPLRVAERVLLVHATSAQVRAMARVLDVAWIERYTIPETHNEQGGGVIMGGSIALGRGFDGSTQVVAVADTGLGNGTAAGAHADIPASRIVAVHDWPSPDEQSCWDALPDGAIDPDSGHGTHTSVSAVGDGGPGGEGRGVAPAADLVFQAIEDYVDMKGICAFTYDDGYFLLGLPLDLHDLFQQAYDDGARIHSNSWGSDAAGDYTFDSADTDDFIFDHPTFTVTFSAGNAGVDDAPTNGVVDPGSVGSPATAKNVIAVGASEGARPDAFPCDTGLAYPSDDPYQSGTCTAQGGHNTLGTGSRWGFTVPPLSNDLTAGNAEQMAPFSSRGPTDDLRIKPDVVAPGTWILSGYSSLYRQGYGGGVNPANGLYQWDGWGLPFNQYYKYMGGTSMSNPLAAGSAAVVADFYVKTAAHVPSAALVKATLVNTARDLLDENNDGANDNDFPIPNQHEGWGIIDLANATDGSHRYVDNTAGLQTAGSAVFQYEVAAGGLPLRLTLAWSDAASTEAAATNLVNDLDLVVVAPNGTTTYVGNFFAGGWSSPSTTYDRVNNLENVYVQTAAAGIWTVTIQGYNVPTGPQPFALVVDGDLADIVDTDPPVITGTPDDTTVEATSAAGATVPYTNPTAFDAVDGPVPVTCLPTSGSTFALGITTVTCTAADTATNQATTQFTVTVADTTAPQITGTPTNKTAEATSAAGATVSYSSPTASDLVDGPVSVTCLPTSGSTFPLGITTVTCTATDNATNQATTQFTVTVVDTTAPQITGTPSNKGAEATSATGATVTYTSPTASDLVDGPVSVTCLPTSGSTFPLGITTVTCTATDNATNQATTQFTVTVGDTTPPVISNVPPDQTVAATGPGGATVAYSNPTANDAVDGAVTVSCLPTSGSTFPLGTTTVTCTATDTNDNQDTADFDITVQEAGGADTVPPVITGTPSNITTEATGPAGATVAYTPPTANDAVDGPVSVTCLPASGSTFPLGITTVTCTATDTATNQATTQFDITVQDTDPPVISNVPGDIAVAATGPGGANVAYTSPTANDAVAGPVAVTCLPTSGSTFPLGITNVTCSASDTADNEATADFTITVTDTPGVVRYSGATRYETAAAISAGEFPDPDAVEVAFVAFGGNFPDALAGAAVAGKLGAPLLLVQSDSIPTAVATELTRLDPNTIVILGGTSVISSNVEIALGGYAPTVIRLAGGDRYATAVEVSEYGFADAGSADTVIVVTGQGFADALAGGPAAVALNGPVLLTNPTSLPAVVAAEITRLAPERIVVIGGTAAVSDAVFDQLEPLAAEVVRIAGASRYQTAIAVSVEAFASASRVYIATGLNFPDALAGGAAAGWWGGPMLLVPGTSLPEEVGNEIVRLGATKVIILGGTGGVSQGVEDALNALIAS